VPEADEAEAAGISMVWGNLLSGGIAVAASDDGALKQAGLEPRASGDRLMGGNVPTASDEGPEAEMQCNSFNEGSSSAKSWSVSSMEALEDILRASGVPPPRAEAALTPNTDAVVASEYDCTHHGASMQWKVARPTTVQRVATTTMMTRSKGGT
jgi:hypothetical protein